VNKVLRFVMVFIMILVLAGYGRNGDTEPPKPNRISYCGKNWYLLGINYPWINYGHDFGDTAWGHNGVSAVLAGWWRQQTYTDSQGITKVMGSSERAYTGGHSLKLSANLIGSDLYISKGEAFVDLRYHAPPGVQVPVNLKGIILRCWIYAPTGSSGEPNHPNGLQIFVKDENWRSKYGAWVNIQEGQWNEVALAPSSETPPDGYMDKDFDPTRIVMVGVKVGTGTGASARFQGAFYLDSFRVGDNVWFDFENPTVAEQDFANMASHIRVVRWFVFGDGRAAPEFDQNGMVTGFDPYFYDDMDVVLAAARTHGIYLILVLFDFHLCDTAKMESGVRLGGHADLITNPTKRQSFIDKALKPMLSRYRGHSHILAWEVMNEPEWAMTIDGGGTVGQPVPRKAMQDFARAIVQSVKATGQLVTLGSASRKWLSLWEDTGLDFFQYHYYDWMETETPLDVHYEQLGLNNKPCILGEFPTKGSKINVGTYLEKAWSNDLAGALAWSFRAGDQASEFSPMPFKQWQQAHLNAPVNISCP